MSEFHYVMYVDGLRWVDPTYRNVCSVSSAVSIASEFTQNRDQVDLARQG